YVVAVALGEPVHEESPLGRAVQDDGAETARLALPRPRHALLDDAATKGSVNQAPLGAHDGFQKRLVRDALFAGKAFEPSVLENPHVLAPVNYLSHLVLHIAVSMARAILPHSP